MNTYQGSCHCKAVTFEAEMEVKNAIECNCSHCYLKGFILAFVPESQVTIKQGEEMLTEYRFNKEHIAHLFCKVCGAQPFGKAANAEGELVYAINLRTLKDIDTEKLNVTPYDGKSI